MNLLNNKKCLYMLNNGAQKQNNRTGVKSEGFRFIYA